MKKRLSTLLLFFLVCTCGCAAPKEPASTQVNYSELTISAIQTLTDGNITDFYQLFDDNMKKELSEQELWALWNEITYTLGAFQYYMSSITFTADDGYQTASVPCVFEQGSMTFRLSFNQQGQISGFFQTDSSNPSGSPRLSEDREITIGNSETPVSGSLTMPTGAGPFPAVVLVQGFGALDRNSQIGPNVPFLELADQLCQQGIAVLRFDSRNYTYPDILLDPTYTVSQEVVQDVAAAVAYLQERDTIQADNIYIAGHGWAGYLMPQIAQAVPDAAGFIMMAASSRTMDQLLLEQATYTVENDGTLDQAAKDSILQQTRELVYALQHLDAIDAAETPILHQRPVGYWIDLQSYHATESMQSIEKPLLFLQGGRDYQVTTEDFNLWKDALSGMTNVHYLYYDNLNHLFMSGTGKSNPAEYQQKGSWNEAVSNDIAAFMQSHSS